MINLIIDLLRKKIGFTIINNNIYYITSVFDIKKINIYYY